MQLKSKFPGHQTEVSLLIIACNGIGLTERQKRHLLENVFYQEQALEHWANLNLKSANQAKKYLLHLAPFKTDAEVNEESASGRQLPGWVRPLARVVGLI